MLPAPISACNKVKLPALSGFEGQIPDFLTDAMPNITFLAVMNSKFMSPIPDFNLPALKILILRNDNLNGNVKLSMFANLQKLHTIDLSYNANIRGVLPDAQFSDIKELKCLYLHGTEIDTPIPLAYLQGGVQVITFPKRLNVTYKDTIEAVSYTHLTLPTKA